MSKTSNPDGTTFKQDLEGLADQAAVIKHDLGVITHDALGTARNGVSELREGAGHAVGAAKERLIKAKDSVKHQVANAEEQAAGAMKSLKQQMSDHPLISVGIAAGVGVIAGILLGRSRS